MTLLWDYLLGAGRNALTQWADKERLGVRERAQLNQKLDLLERVGFDTARRMQYLAGTSGDNNHIFKLIVKSQRMLRPMLCRGPADMHLEITLLCGAIEKDFTLHPGDAAVQAEKRRQTLSASPADTEENRTAHVRF